VATDGEDDFDEFDVEAWQREQEEHELSAAGIAEQNGFLLRGYRDFRQAADRIVAVWQGFPEVASIALIGSAAMDPWKEVPRFRNYRRARIELWHECKDLDLALWLTDLGSLNELRRAKNRALRDLHDETGIGVAAHQTDVFILEPGSDRYLGRLCDFNRCPKGKPECLVPGCGASGHLRQIDGFRFRRESLAPGRMVRLFDRASGALRRAADLPLPVADLIDAAAAGDSNQ